MVCAPQSAEGCTGHERSEMTSPHEPKARVSPTTEGRVKKKNNSPVKGRSPFPADPTPSGPFGPCALCFAKLALIRFAHSQKTKGALEESDLPISEGDVPPTCEAGVLNKKREFASQSKGFALLAYGQFTGAFGSKKEQEGCAGVSEPVKEVKGPVKGVWWWLFVSRC